MDLIIIVSGIVAALLAAAIGFLLKSRIYYKNYYRLLWKDSSSIKPSDILGERPYNDYYFEREFDIQLHRLLERRRNTLLTGSTLSGKSRAVFNALKKLNKKTDILSTRSVAMPHFQVPFNPRFWKNKLIFIDDLQCYVEKQDNFHLMFKSAKEKKTPVIAVCPSGHELKMVKDKMIEQNLDLEDIFGEDIIEIDKLTPEAGKEIAEKLGMSWGGVKYNGTVGSIFMLLNEMEQHYDNCSNAEKNVLLSLCHLYIGGIYNDNAIFQLDWLKKAAGSYDLEGKDNVWTEWLKSLEDKKFVRILRHNKVWAEAAYLEFIVKPHVAISGMEVFDELTGIFSDNTEVLLMLGERVYDSGINDTQISDYMKIAIRALNFVLDAAHADKQKLKAKLYLGNAYWSLAKAENTLENCNYAIGYFNEVIKSIDRKKMPFEYANIKTKIGKTYAAFAETEKKYENCSIAIEAYNDALEIFTNSANSVEYAKTYNNLGGAYLILAEIDKPAENLKRAIDCFKKSLEVRTIKEYPKDYALTKNNLANTYTLLSGYENPVYNLKLAILCFEDALSVYSDKKPGLKYGVTMNNLGNAYSSLAAHENKKHNLEKAIAAYSNALIVRTVEKVPLHYSGTMTELGSASLELSEITGDSLLIDKAVDCFKEALKVRTLENSPVLYGKTQYLLGMAYLRLARGEDKSENYTYGIKAFDESLKVFDESNNPEMFKLIQNEITRAKKIFFE